MPAIHGQHDNFIDSDEDLLLGFTTPLVMEYGINLPLDSGLLLEGDKLFMEAMGIHKEKQI